MTDPERAERFGKLIAKIEVTAERIRLGLADDILFELAVINDRVIEATEIAREVSREALDEVTRGEG